MNRQEFLKLGSITPLFYLLPANNSLGKQEKQKTSGVNILILVFDALSGLHLSLYGYPRNTTPNLNRFAEHATVYHRHYSGGNFTTPGVATMLTGTYPFTHRAFQTNNKTSPEFTEKNLFSLFDDHHRIAYTHNTVADTLLQQFGSDLQTRKPPAELFLQSNTLVNQTFARDNDIAYLSWNQVMAENEQSTNNSLFLSRLERQLTRSQQRRYQQDFPDGLPEVRSGELFLLEHALDWIANQLVEIAQPFMGYFHFFPPHNPYHTRKEFRDFYKADEFNPEAKPRHPFSGDFKQPLLNDLRRDYDEYILYLDAEFGRFMHNLEENGVLKNSWVIFTSDHGELFERGIWRHTTPVLFEPLLHIPLLISAPGQSRREDIFSPTSGVDLLPTLLQLTGRTTPDWCEGQILTQNSALEQTRSIYALEAKKNGKYERLTKATSMLLQWPWKLTQYSGYDNTGGELYYDLFNLEEDPQELSNKYSPSDKRSRQMREELQSRLSEADEPYI